MMRVPKFVSVVAAAAVMMTVALSAGSPATAAPAEKPADRGAAVLASGAAFQIVNRGTNDCVDVKDGSLVNRARIHSWSCHNGQSQRWLAEDLPYAPGYVALRNINSNLCLDLNANSSAEVVNGTVLQQYECRPDLYASERWKLTPALSVPGYLYLVNWEHGMCMDLKNGSSSNGTPIQVWECKGAVNPQLWRLV